MSWHTLSTALDLVLGSQRNRVQIAFYGGEPLLALPMIQRAVAESERRRRTDQEVVYSLSTNGILMGDEATAFMVRHGVETQLSFDGVADAQDLRGAGTFPLLDALLDRLVRDAPAFFAEKVGVSMTVVPATVPLLAAGIGYLLDKGVRSIVVAPAVGPVGEWPVESITCLEEQFARVEILLRRPGGVMGPSPLTLFRRREVELGFWGIELPMCGIGGPGLTVDVDGALFGCALLAESYQEPHEGSLSASLRRLRIGNVRTPDLAGRLERFRRRVRHTEILQRKSAKHSVFGQCCECEHYGWCQVCPGGISRIPGNSDPTRVPDFACAFYRVAGKYRDRHLAYLESPERRPMAC